MNATSRYSAPSIAKSGFNCPNCGLLTPQRWQNVFIEPISKAGRPYRDTAEEVEETIAGLQKETRENIGDDTIASWRRAATGEVFSSPHGGTLYSAPLIRNLNVAVCAECGEVSVWVANEMIYPLGGEIQAHEDLPASVTRTFNEASKIVSVSPRASTALARLALQQLCGELGCKKSKIDEQIAELVVKGLNPDVTTPSIPVKST